MSVKLVSMNCPSCGAQIDVPADRDMCYCSYCGQQIKIDDGSYTVTHRIVDEADITRAKGDAFAKKKWAGISEDTIKIGIRLLAAAVAVTLVIGIIGFIRGDDDPFEMFTGLMGAIVFVGIFGMIFYFAPRNRGESEEDAHRDEVRMPMSGESFKKTQVDDAVEQLCGAGFTDVSSVAVHDLNFLNGGKKEGLVKEVTVDGDDYISTYKWYNKDAHIVVSYHSR